MADLAKVLAIGLTGPFGSGCSTMAEALEKRHNFRWFALSSPVREIWEQNHPDAKTPAPRAELQDIGNELRARDGRDTLAKRIIKKIEETDELERVAIDGIKNEAEVAYLREQVPYFFLVAIQSTSEARWNRVRDHYDALGRPYADFVRDEVRDQVEDLPHGQQVQLCVDDADVAVNNDEVRQSHSSAVRALGLAMAPHLGLMTQKDLRAPSRDEIIMSIAYSQAKASMCLKRHVGAVIADAAGSVVATGFNENPASMKPCYLEFGYCHKDAKMTGELEGLVGTMCPNCGSMIDSSESPFHCTNCGLSLTVQYFPDRGMRWCTALHAEERALANAAGNDLKDATLYSTTFPCSNCAREIAHRGIKRVVYVEPYPDKEGLWYFEQNGIEVTPFEGVKARAFERLFKPFRQALEKKYALEPER